MTYAQILISPLFISILWLHEWREGQVPTLVQTKAHQQLRSGIKYIHAPQRMMLLGALDTLAKTLFALPKPLFYFTKEQLAWCTGLLMENISMSAKLQDMR